MEEERRQTESELREATERKIRELEVSESISMHMYSRISILNADIYFYGI